VVSADETTIAAAHLVMAGVLERHPEAAVLGGNVARLLA